MTMADERINELDVSHWEIGGEEMAECCVEVVVVVVAGGDGGAGVERSRLEQLGFLRGVETRSRRVVVQRGHGIRNGALGRAVIVRRGHAAAVVAGAVTQICRDHYGRTVKIVKAVAAAAVVAAVGGY